MEDICAAREAGTALYFTYKVDTEYEFYLNNWYIEMDLMCTPDSKISSMYSMHFIGIIVSCFLVVIPDRIGRKKSVIYGMALSITAQIVMLLVPNFLVRTACFFVMGIANLKNS